MKITIKLNGVNVSREIPVSWDQVTFAQFLAIADAGEDLAKRLSIFTGLEPDTLRRANIANLDTVLTILSFIDNTDIDMSNVPKQIAGYDMPSNLAPESIGQFEDLKLEAAKIKDNKDTLKAYAMFCAIYATNPYDFKEAESKLDVFMQSPCSEVLAIGNFTLVKLIESKNPSLINHLKPPSRMKRLKLVIKSWLLRLVFTARYYSWKRKLRINEMNS